MYKQIIILILLLTFNNLNAQTDEQILNEILFDLFDSHFDLFDSHDDTIMINNIKTKTYFEYDSLTFNNITGLTVPSGIISEWNDNEENEGFNANWNERCLNKIDTLFIENDTVIGKKPVFKCMSKAEIDRLFELTKKRQKIYLISKMLFDNSKENAVFHFVVFPWPGDFYSQTILIKKVFGNWKIIDRFDYIMS